MNYESFTKELISALKARCTSDYTFEFQNAVKNNNVCIRTLIIKDNSCLAPSINLEPYLDSWNEGMSIEKIADAIYDIVSNKPSLKVDFAKLSLSDLEEHIVYALINYDANQNFLAKVPHIRFLDLAIIFKLESSFLDISGFITITTHITNYFKISKAYLLSKALQNTPKLYPIQFFKLNDLIDLVNNENEEQKDVPAIWICSNSEKYYGATTILYDEFYTHLEELDYSDSYVLPSSLHEVIIVKKAEHNADELKAMVNDVNNTSSMDPMDILSGNIYTIEELRNCIKLVKESYL